MIKRFLSLKIVKDFWRDLTKKEYIPLKILYFLLHGGMMTLFPFLTIQARSLGITEDEIGIIYSLLPVVGIFAPAFAGMLADKVGNFKILLSLMVSLSACASLLFLAVPPSRLTEELPAQLPMSLTCSYEGEYLQIQDPENCEINHSSSGLLNIERCYLKCVSQPEDPLPSVAPLNSSDKWCSLTENCLFIQVYDGNKTLFELPKDAKNTGKVGMNSSYAVVQNEDKPTELQLNERFCPSMEELTEAEASEYNIAKGQHYKDCKLHCRASASSQDLCSNDKYTRTLSPYTTVFAYGSVRLVNGFTLATSLPLFEGAVVAIVKENQGDFGLQRVYANLGMVVLTPISGALIDYFSSKGRENFNPAFYLYFALKLCAAVIILFMDLKFKQPSNNVIKDFKHLITMPEVAIFIIMTALSGVSYGFLDTFLFWLLQDIGADKRLMGITVTVGASVGIPLLIFATPLIKRFGHVNILSFSLGVFSIRMLGYSLIYNPWFALPFEALECITISLVGVVSLSYSSSLSTQSTVASLQGIYAGTLHGVGRGLGSLLGGFLIKSIGIRVTFQLLSGSCALGAIVYVALNLTKIKTWKEARLQKYKDQTTQENTQNPDAEKNAKEHEIEKDKHFTKEVNSVVSNGTFSNKE